MRKTTLGIFLLLVSLQGAAWGGQRSFGDGFKSISAKLRSKGALTLCSLKHSLIRRQLQRFTTISLKQILREDSGLKRAFKESRSSYLNRKKLVFNQCTSLGLIAGPLTYVAGAQIAHQPLGKILMAVGGARFIWGLVGARLWHRMVQDASTRAYQDVFPEVVKVRTEAVSTHKLRLP